MSRFAKKAVILSVIFLLAVGGYFIWNQKHADPDIFYTSIEDANLPVVYMEMYGEAVNGLHGYFKEDSRAAAREALTVLPADRRLGIRIGEADGALTGIQYEAVSYTHLDVYKRQEMEIRADREGRRRGGGRRHHRNRAGDRHRRAQDHGSLRNQWYGEVE